VNLYAEINANLDPQAPAQTTYYPTAGTLLYAKPNILKTARGSYRTSLGTAFYIVGPNVYFLTINKVLIFIGAIADIPSQIYFSDNGLVCVFVDGQNGYVIDLATNTLGIILDPNFYPADYVTLLDTFFIYNRAGTNQFFITESNADFADLTNSSIATGAITAGGAAYTNGTYENVPFTGGTGTGATGNFIITGGAITGVTLGSPGQGYIVGDILSVAPATVGGTGAGFTWTVDTNASAFDPLDIAAKSGFNDPIVGIVSVHRELWLIGALTTEVWIDTGAADFTFQEQQGAYINHGCAAQYSIATMDVLVFFIMQDQQGNGIVVQGQGYDVTEISTPRIVSEFKSYATITDAIGFCFQIEDHSYYGLVFPTANKGWLYDLTTKQWNEWNWLDSNGNLNRPRANCCMFAYGANLIGDWESGNLLQLDINTFTDYTDANPTGSIVRIRTFPHSTSTKYSQLGVATTSYAKVSYNSFDADMEVGTILDDSDPQISLSWSDNKGVSYGNPVMQSMGKIGEYLTTITWNRLGQARDRVFKLQWSTNNKTALNGGFIESTNART
jgi:hypothetical protein